MGGDIKTNRRFLMKVSKMDISPVEWFLAVCQKLGTFEPLQPKMLVKLREHDVDFADFKEGYTIKKVGSWMNTESKAGDEIASYQDAIDAILEEADSDWEPKTTTGTLPPPPPPTTTTGTKTTTTTL